MALDDVLRLGKTVRLGEESAIKLEKGSDGNARDFLKSAINADAGIETIFPSTTDSNILTYVPSLLSNNLTSAATQFATDPANILNDAETRFSANIASNYWLVTPTNIGQPAHDAITNIHKPVFLLYNAIKNFGGEGSAGASAQFIGQTVPLIKINVEQRLLARGAGNPAAIREFAERVAAAYSVSSPEQAYTNAGISLVESKARLDANFGDDDEKVAYVRRSLDQYTGAGQFDNAALALERVINSKERIN
jgi:hypothetical protein